MERERKPKVERPKHKRRLETEEPIVVAGVSMFVWRYKRKWYIGWSADDDEKVWYRGRARS